MNNKKYLHLVGNDINIFCGKAGNGIDDKITNNPLNSTHIYNALCVLFNKTPIPQKKKIGQIYDDKIFYKHDDIMALLENTYFKISDLSGNGKFDISKSGSHTNNTVKEKNSRPTNNVQLTWYDIKQYIGDNEKFDKFRSDLSEKFNINIEDSLQNCMAEFHKLANVKNIVPERGKYIFDTKSIYGDFIKKYKTQYNELITNIDHDIILGDTKKITWLDYEINKDEFYSNIDKFNFPIFETCDEFISWFRTNSIEYDVYFESYNNYVFTDDINEWCMSWKKNKLTRITSILLTNKVNIGTKDMADIYNACNKMVFRGFENSKKFKIELKVILDDEMRTKLNNGLGYCTIGDGGLLKCIDYKEMTFHEMYGFVNLKSIDTDMFWTKLRK